MAFWVRLREYLNRCQRILVQNSHRLAYGAFGVGVTWDGRLPDRFFAGAIDEIRIYEATLSAENIGRLYRGEEPGAGD